MSILTVITLPNEHNLYNVIVTFLHGPVVVVFFHFNFELVSIFRGGGGAAVVVSVVVVVLL